MFRNLTYSSSGGAGSRDSKNKTEVPTDKRNGTTAAEGEARQKRGSQETKGRRWHTKQNCSEAKVRRGGNKHQKTEGAGARKGGC